MTESNEDEYGMPGTHPISTVWLSMWKEDGTPVPTVQSAICDICGGWASEYRTTTRTSTAPTSTLTHVRVSREVRTIVYSCPEHVQQVALALVNEFGHCSNHHGDDDLPKEVLRVDRMHFHESAREQM